MKKYHLTFLRDGMQYTAFAEISSIAMFIAIEKELGRKIHILYSREVPEEEWEIVKEEGLYFTY